ncbi:MAG: hypothetical protein M1819_006633 [Sarea resinae]|nr:MAG: hypothetical protein M1819_006633 [Sarea resinae]
MQILSLLAPLVIAAAVAVASSSPAPVPDLTHVLAGNKNLTSINELIHKYGDLYATLSFTEGITLLAPSNDAFNKIPYSALRDAFETNDTAVIRAILDYHVINGTHTTASFSSNFQFLPTWLNNASYTNVTGGAVVSVVKQAGDDVVFVSGEGDRSSLSTADILYTGGVIQVIDTFLIPPETFLSTVPTFNLTSAGGLATKAKLDDYLDTTEDLTIFAPSNDALEGIGSGLEDMTVQELAELFSYHVVNGTIGYSAALPNGTILKSLQGGNLTVRFGSNSLYVNSAKIIQQDILLANGVMHVIDK